MPGPTPEKPAHSDLGYRAEVRHFWPNPRKETRTPVGFVVLAGPSPALPSGDREAYGPFEDEDAATLWLSERLPERVLFTIFPLFDTIYP